MKMKTTICWLSLIIIFSLSNTVFNCDFTYTELLEVGGSCYPRDTCSTLETEEDDNLWNNRTCECGQHCVRHRTCCIDSPYTNHEPLFNPENEECQKVQTSSKTVMMVSHCSLMWQKHSAVYNKCEDRHDLEDPIAESPVTSLITSTTYKNYFCALCNYDDEQTVLWDIAIKKDTPDNSILKQTELLNKLFYNMEYRAWGISEEDPHTKKEVFQKIKMEFKPQASLLKIVKKCYPGMVSHCSSLHWSEELYEKCYSYYAPVRMLAFRNRFVKYRNVHCALCNNLNVSQADVDICTIEPTRRKTKPSLSFALLLDVNPRGGEKVGKMQTCNGGQVFDPFFKKCRTMTCVLPGYVVKNGACTKD